MKTSPGHSGATVSIAYKQPEVFRNLFQKNFPKLVLFAERYLNEREPAADIAQECFVRLWKSDAQFPTEEKVVGFLYTTARHLSLDYIKHSGVIQTHAQSMLLETESFFREAIEEEEAYEIIYRAIDCLSPQARQVILLSLDEKSNPEIAEILKISVNSVRTHKQNAYKKLKAMLQEYFIFFLLLHRKLFS